MSKAIFKLRNKEAIDKTTIFLHYKIGRLQKLVYSTGETIKPENWDFETQAARENIKGNKELLTQLKTVNLQLGRYKTKVLEVENFWTGQKIVPTIEGLRVELDKEFKVIPEPQPQPEPTPEKITLFGFIDNYIKTVKFTREPQPKPINLRTIQKYRTTLRVLRDFAKSKRKGRLDFENIDLDFYHDFVEYLQKNCNHTTNTIGKYIKTLKVFLKEATEAGINSNRAFESKKFAGLTELVDHIYLTETDLDLLWNLDLSKNKRLEAVRDLFLVSCYTGLRFQDFTTITPENILDGNKLKITTRKTGKTVQIPIHWRVAELLAKYENHLPRAISNQKMNDYLKEVGEMAGIDATIEKVLTKGGLRYERNYKKFELMTCHTGRRTFATNTYLAGVPAISIMKLTGHATEAVFMRYLNISGEENANLLMNHDYFTKGRLRAI